ncbi:MAG: Ubiquinone biosynthesis O-methyltransferase [candidate division WS2 bacterium]|nr:Ubiquinone biosynthesis O-methyltransferase [Candidatus Psychracetigena formicireducens]
MKRDTQKNERHNYTGYRSKLLETYFSSHYQDIAPKEDKHWWWVIQLSDQSFGKVFSGLSREAPILDAGCGVGYLEFYLLKKGFTNIDAVDISAEQINAAKEYMKAYRVDVADRVRFHCIDIIEYLKSSSTAYAVIAAIDILEHFSKDEVFTFLELVYNALDDEGCIIVRVPNMEHPFRACYHLYHDFTHETGFTCSSLKQCLLAAGFDAISVNFEKWPPFPTQKSLIQRCKQIISPFYYSFLATLLRVSSGSFSPNIVAIGKKR